MQSSSESITVIFTIDKCFRPSTSNRHSNNDSLRLFIFILTPASAQAQTEQSQHVLRVLTAAAGIQTPAG